MKKLSLILFALVIVLSCKKDQDGPESVFRFKANGKQYELNVFANTKDSTNAFISHPYSYSGYMIYAEDMTNNKIARFIIGFPYDTVLKKQMYSYLIRTNSYTTATLTIASWNNDRTTLTGHDYTNGLYDDYVNINITNIEGDRVSGEFNARLTTVGNIGDKMIITDGTFTNLKIVH